MYNNDYADFVLLNTDVNDPVFDLLPYIDEWKMLELNETSDSFELNTMDENLVQFLSNHIGVSDLFYFQWRGFEHDITIWYVDKYFIIYTCVQLTEEFEGFLYWIASTVNPGCTFDCTRNIETLLNNLEKWKNEYY